MSNDINNKSIDRQTIKKVLINRIAFYEKMASSLDALILIYDINQLRVIWANEVFARVLGYSLSSDQQMEEQKVIDMYHPDDREYIKSKYATLEKNPDSAHTAFYRFRHAKGHYVWLFSSSRVFKKDSASNAFEIITISVDFTGPLSYQKNMKLFAQEKLRDINAVHVQKITKRERHILQFFSRGYNTREIGGLLGISYHTVNNHRKNMLKKLGLKNLSALVNFAAENGLD